MKRLTTASNAAGAGETGSSGLGLADMFWDVAKAAGLRTRVAPSLRVGGGTCALRGHQVLCVEINTGAYRGVPRDVVLMVDIAVVDNGVVEGQLGPRGSASKPCFGEDKTAHAHGLIHRIDDLASAVAFFRHDVDDKHNGSGYFPLCHSDDACCRECVCCAVSHRAAMVAYAPTRLPVMWRVLAHMYTVSPQRSMDVPGVPGVPAMLTRPTL